MLLNDYETYHRFVDPEIANGQDLTNLHLPDYRQRLTVKFVELASEIQMAGAIG